MPLWKVVAKLGFKLRLRVVAKYEHDSMSYYVAFSDLRSLNTDSELLDSLRANIKECALLLLSDFVEKYAIRKCKKLKTGQNSKGKAI